MAYVKIMPTLSLFGRSLIDWVHIGGRARRSELLLFWSLTSLLQLTIADTASLWLDGWRNQQLLKLGMDAVQALPLMAIFIRRLHDQDRTAWWALPTLPVLLSDLWQRWRFAIDDPARLLGTPDPIGQLPFWAGLPLVLCFMLLCILPGTIGANRYGPDPRAAERAFDARRGATP